MKYRNTILLMSAVGLALTILPASARPGNRGGGQQGNRGNRITTVEKALSPAEAKTLGFMREEEKLARDVYLFLFDLWGNRVFSNISKSEQRHMVAIKNLLDKYGLPDTSTGEEGVFNDPELQELYDHLLLRGAMSELEALRVGGLIEEVDIADLVDAIDGSSHPDLDRVYTNLMNGSHKHLRAFASQIRKLTGESYQAQYLSQKKVDEVLGETVDKPRRGKRNSKAGGRGKGGSNRGKKGQGKRR